MCEGPEPYEDDLMEFRERELDEDEAADRASEAAELDDDPEDNDQEHED
jgi:hypothetical protein